LQWARGINETLGLPQGYLLSFGTQNPPKTILQQDVKQRTQFSTGNLEIQTAYYWQVIPYGFNNQHSTSCPVWKFTTGGLIISTFPYSQDFEERDNGWIAYGQASSWQLGTPHKQNLTEAASGANAWVTNLVGNYNASESSEVRSPIFNFSTMVDDPSVRMSVWCNSETNFDGAAFQYSLNGEDVWTTIGDTNSSWYNSANINSMPGGSKSGWTGDIPAWTIMEHILVGLAGKKQVVFRVAFASDEYYSFGGFAFDNFWIVQTTELPFSGLPSHSTSSAAANKAASATTDRSETLTAIVASSVAISLLAVGVVICAIVLFLWKKKSKRQNKQFLEMETKIPQPTN